MFTHQVLLAQAGGSPSSLFIFIAGMFAIMYFLMIRPQQKQLKEHRALLAALKKGDLVVTQGGIIGRIFPGHREGSADRGREQREAPRAEDLRAAGPQGSRGDAEVRRGQGREGVQVNGS